MAADCRKKKPGGREAGSAWMRWRWARALPGISSVMSVLHLGCLYYCIAVLQRGNTWCNAMLQRAMQCSAMQCNATVVSAAALGTCRATRQGEAICIGCSISKTMRLGDGSVTTRSSQADVAAMPPAVLRLLCWQLSNTQNSHKRVFLKRCADAASPSDAWVMSTEGSRVVDGDASQCMER